MAPVKSQKDNHNDSLQNLYLQCNEVMNDDTIPQDSKQVLLENLQSIIQEGLAHKGDKI